MTTSKHDLVAPHNPDPIIVTRGLVKRAWSDFEPKVVSGLMSGTIAAGAIQILSAYGVHIPTPVLSALPVFCMTLAGWMTPSVGTSTTIRTGDGLVVEKHSGNTEIRTGAIPIPGYTRSAVPRETTPAQPTFIAPAVPFTPPASPMPVPTPDSDPNEPAPLEVPDQASAPSFTEVLAPETPSRVSAFLANLPSANGGRAAFYEDDKH